MSEWRYLYLLRACLENGVYREGRNGGTYGLFGRQMRFDLSEGFPLLTTKKMFTTGMVDELIWFLSGSTNAHDLPERSQHWWTPWARADGELGPIYGQQYRQARWWFETTPLVFTPPKIEKKEGLFCGVGDIGSTANLRGQSVVEMMLKNIWRDMLKRCYDENSKSYTSHGAQGIHVAPEWHSFDTFSADAKTLKGWQLKLTYPDDYSLDKDVLRASNRYSKETCMWASHAEQSLNTSTGRPFLAISPGGGEYLFPSIGDANRRFGLNVSAVHRALQGKLKTHHGWSGFRYATATAGTVMRFREVDQLKQLIAGLRCDPYSRRHLINLWNTPAMDHAELPCCHGAIIQFYVADGKLSCQSYQRSADILLGVPVNIASYALLTHLVAREVGLDVGEFVHTFGDVHLYANHVEQAQLQLTRLPLSPPKLVISSDKSIWDISREDISFEGYHPHPAIKAEVSV